MEALGCAEILKPSLLSYLAHHEQELHVIVYENEREFIPLDNRLIVLAIKEDSLYEGLDSLEVSATNLREAFQKGHNGTALLWSKIISMRKEDYLVHLDADTIFLDDVVTPILTKLNQGFGIVGTRRLYRNSSFRRKKLEKLLLHFRRDAISTHCFGFNKERISLDKTKLTQFINGQGRNRISQRIFPVVDFFDRLTFNIARNGGIYYLDSSNQERHGVYEIKNEFEDKMISFAAVGSGCAFYKNPKAVSSQSYREFALASYSLYSRALLDKEIEVEPLHDPILLEKLARLDTKNWSYAF